MAEEQGRQHRRSGRGGSTAGVGKAVARAWQGRMAAAHQVWAQAWVWQRSKGCGSVGMGEAEGSSTGLGAGEGKGAVTSKGAGTQRDWGRKGA